MRDIPLPKARVGDVIVGDTHPHKPGLVMFRVGRAYRKDFHWIYVSEDRKTEVTDSWVQKIYKNRSLK